MNIEKEIRNYLAEKDEKINEDNFCAQCKNNPNSALDVLFKLINEEIDNPVEDKRFDKIVELLELVRIIFFNLESVNKKLITRKLTKLSEKTSLIIFELNFSDKNKIKRGFNKIERKLNEIKKALEICDSKQYNFINYLIENTKDTDIFEKVLKNMPTLANVKDKNEVSLIRNLLVKYISSLEENIEKDIYYYENLISILTSQKKFRLSEAEKQKCLKEIYKAINKISAHKKDIKSNRSKLDRLSKLTKLLKEQKIEKLNISKLAEKYHIEIGFDDILKDDVALIQKDLSSKMTDREEVVDYTISIDKAKTVEIDDALSCRKLDNGNYLLGVHIASVLGYFPYESEIVQNAIKRNQSIYLYHGYRSNDKEFHTVIPIFPYEFCADIASLKKVKSRLARSYYFEINSYGEIVNERFAKSIVRNNKQLTYEQANNVLEGQTTNIALRETLNNLLEVTKIIDRKYPTEESYEKEKEKLSDVAQLRVSKRKSENIVYQAMLLTGNRVAEFFAKNNYPLIYRTCEINQKQNKKIEDMIHSLNKTYGGIKFKNLYKLVNEIYPKGWYSVGGRHDGLSLEHYCHCTSALRRAADIVVEHALEVCYDKEPTEEELAKLKLEIADKVVEINAKQSPIEYFSKEYNKKYPKQI